MGKAISPLPFLIKFVPSDVHVGPSPICVMFHCILTKWCPNMGQIHENWIINHLPYSSITYCTSLSLSLDLSVSLPSKTFHPQFRLQISLIGYRKSV